MPVTNKIIIPIIGILLAVSAALFFVNRTHSVTQARYDYGTLIINGEIVTMNAGQTVIPNGWIAMSGNTIAAMGSGSPTATAQSVINVDGAIVMPGMVNTHSHAAMALLRNTDDDDTMAPWLQNVGKEESRLTPNDVYQGSLLAGAEMLKSGVTTFNDMYFYPDQTALAATQLGMRAMVRVPVIASGTTLTLDNNFYQHYHNSDLISLNLSPNPLDGYSLPQLQWFAGEANTLNVPVHIHIADDLTSVAALQSHFGLTPLQLLENSGLINNKLIMAHAIFFSPDDITALAAHPNIGVSFNPKSEYLLSDTSTPISEYLSAGVPLGFGTDGGASSPTLDLFSQMNFAAFTSRCSTTDSFCRNKRQVTPQTYVFMATMGGAKVLGMDKQIGSLETGKRADVVVIRQNNINQIPNIDPYTTLVYNTDPSDVQDVWVNGREVVQNGVLTTLDQNRITSQAQALFKNLK